MVERRSSAEALQAHLAPAHFQHFKADADVMAAAVDLSIGVN